MTRPSAFPLRDRIAVVLLVLMLAARVLVPAGWMPAEGRGVAITLCSGAGSVPAWVDVEGRIHKQDPAKSAMPDHPCAFAGLGAPVLDGEGPAAPPVLATPRDELAGLHLGTATIGRGLAAPPPPATGPPTAI